MSAIEFVNIGKHFGQVEALQVVIHPGPTHRTSQRESAPHVEWQLPWPQFIRHVARVHSVSWQEPSLQLRVHWLPS